MLARYAHLLLVTALSLTLGLHWMVLQSVGWTTMLIRNSGRTSSFREALAKTFDGQHPCSICRIVKEGQRSAPAPESSPDPLKIDFFAQTGATFYFPDPVRPAGLHPPPFPSARQTPPPTPPPRLCVA